MRRVTTTASPSLSVSPPIGPGSAIGATTDGAIGTTTDRPTRLRGTGRIHADARGAWLGVCGLLIVVATGLLICLAAPSTPDERPQSLPSLPSIVHMGGLFGGSTIHLRSGELIGALCVMFAGYLIAVREAERLSPRLVIGAILAFVAVVVVAPPLFSTDVFSYEAYARMFVTYGINPYRHGPNVLQLAPGLSDPISQYIGAKWIGTPSVYGPLFTLLSGAFATISVAATAFVFKAIAAVSCLVTLALVWHGAKLRGVSQVRAAALFGLNPLVVLYGVGGGHNDLLMCAFTTAGIVAVLARRDRGAGVAIVLGTAIKLTGGLVFPFAVASCRGVSGRDRRRSMVLGAAVTSVVMLAAGFAAFGSGLFQMPFTLDRVQNEGAWQSVPGFITTVLRLGFIGHAVGLLLGVLFVVFTVRTVLRVWRGELDWIDGLAMSTLLLLITTSSLLAWYLTWLLVPVALCRSRRLWSWTHWFSGYALFTTILAYIPHGVAFLGV